MEGGSAGGALYGVVTGGGVGLEAVNLSRGKMGAEELESSELDEVDAIVRDSICWSI